MLLSHAGPQDGESFHLEMRAFLVELCCPHTALTQDLSALDSHLNRLLLIGQPFYMTPPTSVSPCRLSILYDPTHQVHQPATCICHHISIEVTI